MRIAIVAGPHIPVPPKQYGGTEQVIFYLIKGLLEAGHEPILLASGDSKVPCELIPIVSRAIYFPAHKSQMPQHMKLRAEINAKTERELRKLLPRIDLIHSHGFDLINFQDFANLTTLHGAFNLVNLSYYQKRRNLFFASISENQQDALPDLQYAGVVYNGEDPAKFQVVKKPEDYVCFLGRFDREKNPHLAIQLAINLGMKIKVAGKVDFQGEDYFKEELEPYLKHPLVEYLGEIGFKDKVELLSNAKCNLHPTSFREPFGLTVLEAAYCGTPTLAIERGSMPELIEPGRTGMLVEDFVEGYHQIQECFEMDREYIARRARQLFNHKAMAQDYVSAYERVIDIFNLRKQQSAQLRALAKVEPAHLSDIWLKGKEEGFKA